MATSTWQAARQGPVRRRGRGRAMGSTTPGEKPFTITCTFSRRSRVRARCGTVGEIALDGHMSTSGGGSADQHFRVYYTSQDDRPSASIACTLTSLCGSMMPGAWNPAVSSSTIRGRPANKLQPTSGAAADATRDDSERRSRLSGGRWAHNRQGTEVRGPGRRRRCPRLSAEGET